jgi:septal ring factor EnvC (AmiA/AmiB activator)
MRMRRLVATLLLLVVVGASIQVAKLEERRLKTERAKDQLRQAYVYSEQRIKEAADARSARDRRLASLERRLASLRASLERSGASLEILRAKALERANVVVRMPVVRMPVVKASRPDAESSDRD